LPSGNRGIAPERVAHHQRMRLMGAMLHACSQHGFAAVTISELSRLAAVSNRDFYEHFPDKEACFLATHDIVVHEGTARISEAFRAQADWRDGMHAAFDEFFSVIQAEPTAAHLVIVDALTAGSRARAHRRQAMRAFERMLRETLDQAGPKARVDDVTIGALIAGTRRVVYRHLRDGRAEELGTAGAPIMDWIMLLWEAAGHTPLPPARRVRKARRSAVSTAVSADGSARDRILAAVVDLAVAGGYSSLSLPVIAKAARCSTQTFYKHFATKDVAFTEAVARAQASTLAAAQPALAELAESPWPRRAAAVVAALLEHCARHPADCELLLRSEIGGPLGVLDLTDDALASFVALLMPPRSGAPHGGRDVLSEAVAGGLVHVLQEQLAHAGPAGLPAIADQITYIMVVSVIGIDGLDALSA
jgi:AcrR family transcriptional regulator